MEKKYQVFVSSTYDDLKDERQEVMQVLLEMNCIPAGMELFPTSDEEIWELIKKVIQDCDYYIVIVAGRYGSIYQNDESFTKREYVYAKSLGIPVLKFLHKSPNLIQKDKCENTQTGEANLIEFRKLLEDDKRMCKYWESKKDLGGLVSRSLNSEINRTKDNVIGWVRANKLDEVSESLINKLKLENTELLTEIRKKNNSAPENISNLSSGNERFKVLYYSNDPKQHQEESFTWNYIFSIIGPKMLSTALSEIEIRQIITSLLASKVSNTNTGIFIQPKLYEDYFQRILIQFRALGLIQIKNSENNLSEPTQRYWTLTPYGEEEMVKLVAVKKQSQLIENDESTKSESQSKETDNVDDVIKDTIDVNEE